MIHFNGASNSAPVRAEGRSDSETQTVAANSRGRIRKKCDRNVRRIKIYNCKKQSDPFPDRPKITHSRPNGQTGKREITAALFASTAHRNRTPSIRGLRIRTGDRRQSTCLPENRSYRPRPLGQDQEPSPRKHRRRSFPIAHPIPHKNPETPRKYNRKPGDGRLFAGSRPSSG